jgi:hypothetical protein
MNNLTIAVIAVAVAQALTILLIIGREKEIKKLRELVIQHRMFISEIKGWLVRERIEPARPRRMRPDRKPTREAPEIKVPEIKAPEIVPEIKAPDIVLGSKASKIEEPTITPKDTREGRPIKPDREPIADQMKAPESVLAKVPEPAKTLRDLLATVQPHTTQDGTKEAATKQLIEASNWLKEDANKARSIIAVQILDEIVNTDD